MRKAAAAARWHVMRRLYGVAAVQRLRLRRQSRRCFADVPVDLGRMSRFRRDLFPESGPLPWLDGPDALARVEERRRAGRLTDGQADICVRFARDGFAVVPGLHSPESLDGAWRAYEAALSRGQLVADPPKRAGDPLPGRCLNPHTVVPELAAFLCHPPVVALVELLLGRPVAPYQTITSHGGSEQMAHSDAIHMTTYPLGYLVATWTAFEDIRADSGPLVYYPGSHRLPYMLSREVGIGPEDYARTGYGCYVERYEPAVTRAIEEHGLRPAVFEAKRGETLIWHANLLHGGSARSGLHASRRAVVCHYFARDAICYHDLTGSLADLSPFGHR